MHIQYQLKFDSGEEVTQRFELPKDFPGFSTEFIKMSRELMWSLIMEAKNEKGYIIYLQEKIVN